MATSCTLTVEEDKETGEMYLTFPPGFLEDLGWDIGTEVQWQQIDNNRWSIQKVNPDS